jgi:hypothetical protein
MNALRTTDNAGFPLITAKSAALSDSAVCWLQASVVFHPGNCSGHGWLDTSTQMARKTIFVITPLIIQIVVTAIEIGFV